MTMWQWMIAVAGTAVVFEIFGVNEPVATVMAAFVLSALITKPDAWQGWVVVMIGAFATLPFMLLASMYTFALRAALFLGDWPYYAHPDLKGLPVHFHPQTEFLKYLVPTTVAVMVTCLFVRLVMRFATWPRRIQFAMLAAFLLWMFGLFLFFADDFGVLEWIMD